LVAPLVPGPYVPAKISGPEGGGGRITAKKNAGCIYTNKSTTARLFDKTGYKKQVEG
jgi:hypothetical protein